MSSWLRRESAVGDSGSVAMSPGAGSGSGSGGGGGSRNGRSGVKRVRFSMGEAGSDGGGVLDPGRTGDATESHPHMVQSSPVSIVINDSSASFHGTDHLLTTSVVNNGIQSSDRRILSND